MFEFSVPVVILVVVYGFGGILRIGEEFPFVCVFACLF